MRLRCRTASAGLLLALAVTTTACGSSPGAGVATAGGGGATPSASASKDPRDAAVEFAQCLREHGVQVADPDDRGTVTIGGDDVDEKKMREAQEACKDKAPALGVDARGLDAAAQERMLEYARCMREQGIDLPDPGADGGLRAEVGNGVDPQSAEFRAAEQACRQYFNPGAGIGGGSAS